MANERDPGRSTTRARLPPELSVVVPTFREAGNLAPLADRLFSATAHAGIRAELLVVDDDSGDGIGTVCRELRRRRHPVRLITRRGERGLASAVVLGLQRARGAYVVAMDADLAHPPELVPAMLQALRHGADFVIGSRYVTGASLATPPPWSRRLTTAAGKLLARPLTRVADPLAGFFGVSRELVAGAGPLSPIGYKIALELLVRARPRRIVELPIHFGDRAWGESKLSPRVQLEYAAHLVRLYRHRLAMVVAAARPLGRAWTIGMRLGR